MRATPLTRHLASAVVLLFLGVLVAGCGSGDDDDADASANTSTTTEAAASRDDSATTSTTRDDSDEEPGGSGSSGGGIPATGEELCAAYPLADVAAATGLALTVIKPNEQTCTYQLAESTPQSNGTFSFTGFVLQLTDPNDAFSEGQLEEQHDNCNEGTLREPDIAGTDDAFVCKSGTLIYIASARGDDFRVNVSGTFRSQDTDQESFMTSMAGILELVLSRA